MSRPTASFVAFPRTGLRGALRVVAGLASLCAFVQVGGAQTPPLTQGARIRVVQTGSNGAGVFEGRLFRLRGDTVMIELSVPAGIAYGLGSRLEGNVQGFVLDGGWRLEVAGQRHRHVGRRVVRGAAIGAVALGVLAYLSYEPCVPQGFLSCMLDTGPGGAAAAGAVGGAFVGGVVGLAVGLLTRDVEWLPARTEGGRLGLGAAVRF